MVNDKIIMVLDDEPGVGSYCRAALERVGYEVIVMRDARKAVGVLQQARVDLLLVDIRMPHLDGFQVMELVRSRQPDLAILVMTGYGTVETATKALRLGANGLILKPFSSTSELVEDVRRAIESREQSRESTRLQALRPLLQISQKLFAVTEQAPLVEMILDAALDLMRCQHAGFYSYQRLENGGYQLALSSARGEPLAGEPAGFEGGPISRADAWGAAFRVGPDTIDDAAMVEHIRAQGLDAVIAAPVLRGEGTNSVILAGRGPGGLPFTDADQEMFSILANQGRAALENASLYADLLATLEQVREQQQALLQTEKMAAIGRLTASIAHEVNNPLQAVRNCLHLVKREDLALEKRGEYLELAQDELQRLMDTVQQMLDFYRPSTLQREPVDINALIQTVLALLGKQFQQSEVRVVTRLSKGLPLLVLVRNQIQQVLFNILLNAMEAMPDGGTITIRTQKAGDQLEILIEDSGPGVPDSTRPRLFEPFVSSKPNGTGLGLSISYSIVDAHGGKIELVDPVKSRKTAAGAVFRICIPLAEAL